MQGRFGFALTTRSISFSDATASYSAASNLTKPASYSNLIRKHQGRICHHFWRVCAVLVTSAMLLSQEAPAQDIRNSLGGSVVDSSGTGIPGAQIGAIIQSTHGGGKSTTSDSQGNFNLTNLEPGTYELAICANGFTLVRAPNVQVNSGQMQSIRATLRRVKPGDVYCGIGGSGIGGTARMHFCMPQLLVQTNTPRFRSFLLHLSACEDPELPTGQNAITT